MYCYQVFPSLGMRLELLHAISLVALKSLIRIKGIVQFLQMELKHAFSDHIFITCSTNIIMMFSDM